MVKKLGWTVVFIILVAGLVYAQEKIIKYLPREEDMTTTSKDYDCSTCTPPTGPLSLYSVVCPPAGDLFQKHAECVYCVQLKALCDPTCCVVLTPSKRAIRCTKEDDPRFDCTEPAFWITDCPQLNQPPQPPLDWSTACNDPAHPHAICCDDESMRTENHYQIRGCAKESPHFSGCTSHVLVCPSDNCISPCNQPQPSDFHDCIERCNNYTNDYDTCFNRRECCRQAVCGTGGFAAHCDGPSCEELVNRPACDNLTPEICAALAEQYTQCILAGGACSNCFQEIDHNFSSRFVARSRQAMTIIWQIATHPPHLENRSTYFFTKVKLFRVSDGAQIHESMVHQKDLGAAFSIFCATHIPSGTLEPGEAYEARVYYYLAPLPDMPPLRVDVLSLRLILVRTRE